MNCNRAKSLMGIYISGDTSAEESLIVRTHTEQCPKCREDLSQRLAICTSFDNSVPELSDEEISRIKWYVKGAVSECNKPRQTLARKLAPVFAMMLFLATGFVFGRWLGTEHNKAASVAVRSPLPVLTVKQNQMQSVSNKKENAPAMQNNSEKTASTSDAQNSGTVSPTAADYFRSLTNAARDVSSAGLATTRASRVYKHNRVIILDQPVPLDIEPDKNIPEDIPDENKLPEPSTLNNAETTQTQPGE